MCCTVYPVFHGVQYSSTYKGTVIGTMALVSPEQENIELWKTGTMLPDQTCFQLFQPDSQIHVWRRLHKAMNPYCQQDVVHTGGSFMME